MSDVTRILTQIDAGVPKAAEQLLPLVYDELRKLAAAKPHFEIDRYQFVSYEAREYRFRGGGLPPVSSWYANKNATAAKQMHRRAMILRRIAQSR